MTKAERWRAQWSGATQARTRVTAGQDPVDVGQSVLVGVLIDVLGELETLVELTRGLSGAPADHGPDLVTLPPTFDALAPFTFRSRDRVGATGAHQRSWLVEQGGLSFELPRCDDPDCPGPPCSGDHP